MSNQNQKQPTEMETKAKIIGRKLKQLQRKCTDPTEKVNANKNIFLSLNINEFFNFKQKKTLEIHID